MYVITWIPNSSTEGNQLFCFFFLYSLAMLMSLGWIAYSVAILVLHGAGPNILQRCWVWLRNHTAYGQYGCVVT